MITLSNSFSVNKSAIAICAYCNCLKLSVQWAPINVIIVNFIMINGIMVNVITVYAIMVTSAIMVIAIMVHAIMGNGIMKYNIMASIMYYFFIYKDWKI